MIVVKHTAPQPTPIIAPPIVAPMPLFVPVPVGGYQHYGGVDAPLAVGDYGGFEAPIASGFN